MKDILKVYLELSSCNMENCPYGFDIECSDCNKKMVAEHDKQIRADAIDECKYNAELFREIFLEDLINQSVDREEAMMYRNICEMAWNKYKKQLKEQKNE